MQKVTGIIAMWISDSISNWSEMPDKFIKIVKYMSINHDYIMTILSTWILIYKDLTTNNWIYLILHITQNIYIIY